VSRVLPAVVVDHPISMVATVELDHEAGLRVVEVGPRARLGNRRLNVGARQPGLHEKPAQA
jgi:hypothetical protein